MIYLYHVILVLITTSLYGLIYVHNKELSFSTESL